MANFATHIGVGTVVAGGLATLTVASGLVTPDHLVPVTLAAVFGSVLPDIDLKDSRPSRALFSGLAIFLSLAVLFTFAAHYSIVEMLLVWIGTLVAVRFGLHKIFHKYAVHRGIWHSLLAAVFSALVTAIVFVHILGRPEGIAWLAASFMFLGFLTHLVLDEIYSVDVMDTRIKASFGTALKVIDRRHPLSSAAMGIAVCGALLLAPSIESFRNILFGRDLWAGLSQRLVPQDKWFGVIGGVAKTHDLAPPLTTGSLPDAGAETTTTAP